jgi:hypothetical protein
MLRVKVEDLHPQGQTVYFSWTAYLEGEIAVGWLQKWAME